MPCCTAPSEVVFADAGYQGVEKRPEQAQVQATWHVAMRPGKRKALGHDAHGRVLESIEKLKASVRAKVEHPFHVVKHLFKMRKVRYRGLAKNTAQLTTLFGMANRVLVKRRLFELDTLNLNSTPPIRPETAKNEKKRLKPVENCVLNAS
jgi:IS5 family transposase